MHFALSGHVTLGVVRWRHELDYICPLWVLHKFGSIETYMCRVIANWFFPSNGIKRYFNGPLSLVSPSDANRSPCKLKLKHKHKSSMSSENERDTKTSRSTSTRNWKTWSLCMCLRLCLYLRRGRFHGEISILMLVLVLAFFAGENQALDKGTYATLSLHWIWHRTSTFNR